jgi:small nuclear ribonucleoprotein B and B'
MLSLINWRLKITINDGRALTGQMLAFDKHMNLVLAECEEFRRVRPKKKPGQETLPEQELKRTLGLVILRGETVVSISVEGPPPVVDEDKQKGVSFSSFLRCPFFSSLNLIPSLAVTTWSWKRWPRWSRYWYDATWSVSLCSSLLIFPILISA